MSTYRAAVIGLGRMGSTFDDEITQGGSLFLPYCHGAQLPRSTQCRIGRRGRPPRGTGSYFWRALGH